MEMEMECNEQGVRRFPNESRPATHFKDSFSATGNHDIDQKLVTSFSKYPTFHILGLLAHSSTFLMPGTQLQKNLVTQQKSEVLGEKS